jgi:histone deacetylase complex subunit SAP30
MDWQKEDTKLLHRYRSAYHLPVPSAFQNPMANCILNSGIGPSSPTMARVKNKRRIRREELAMIVRRNFKEAPVIENECLVDLIYRVKVKGVLNITPVRTTRINLTVA